MNLPNPLSWLRRPRQPTREEIIHAYRRQLFLSKAAALANTPGFKKYYADDEPKQRKDTTDPVRRAVHTMNYLLGIQGIPRDDFSAAENDRWAKNAIYAMMEKRMMDYFATAEWEIVDKAEKQQTDAMDFIEHPNGQQTFTDILKATARDAIRYDAAAWALTPDLAGNLVEFRAYYGPDFWIETDRAFETIEGAEGLGLGGYWSHGYVKRYWQHGAPGIYIPFEPSELCYFMLYPRTDSVYGTDFIRRLRWYLEYSTDATKAAGMTFANGIAPGAVMTHPSLSSQEQLEERVAELDLTAQGVENFGGLLHLIGDEKLEPFMPTLVDMQWQEGQKFVVALIGAMFGLPVSEILQGDVNRATAYISRTITKSAMLYPLQVSFESMINDRILPLLEGYQKGWTFRFVDTVDLDDELKRAQIAQTRAQVASTYTMMGVPLAAALQLAEVDEELRTAVAQQVLESDRQEPAWNRGSAPETEGLHVEEYAGTDLADPGTTPPQQG